MAAVPKTYDPGDTISMNALFFNKQGVKTDPTSVVVKIRKPDGTQVQFTPTHTTTGAYNYDYVSSLSDPVGRWEYRFEGTGTVTTAEEGAFFLRQSEFT